MALITTVNVWYCAKLRTLIFLSSLSSIMKTISLFPYFSDRKIREEGWGIFRATKGTLLVDKGYCRHCGLDPQSPHINGGLRVKPAMTVHRQYFSNTTYQRWEYD
jgi:hypothetical protein